MCKFDQGESETQLPGSTALVWYHIPPDKELYKLQYLPGLESTTIYYLEHM